MSVLVTFYCGTHTPPLPWRPCCPLCDVSSSLFLSAYYPFFATAFYPCPPLVAYINLLARSGHPPSRVPLIACSLFASLHHPQPIIRGCSPCLVWWYLSCLVLVFVFVLPLAGVSLLHGNRPYQFLGPTLLSLSQRRPPPLPVVSCNPKHPPNAPIPLYPPSGCGLEAVILVATRSCTVDRI